MQQININELKPHPRNNEFFDDMTGEKWSEFIESVKSRGVIEPIVITPDKTIVSGHQRVRACAELEIPYVMCDVHTYDNEDQVLQDLIETNVKQRGEVGGSAKKIGKRIKELERIYGISHGNNQHVRITNNSESSKSQEQLAKQMGLSVDTLQNYKALAEMIPELEELLDTGIVTKTTALAMMKELNNEEQVELISSLDVTEKITKAKMQQYINEIRELRSNPPKPADYESTKQQLNSYKTDYTNLKRNFDSKIVELQELRKQVDNMKSNTPTEQYNKKLRDSTILFCSKVADFIEKIGGYVWLTDHLNELPDYEKNSYMNSVKAVHAWASVLLNNIEN